MTTIERKGERGASEAGAEIEIAETAGRSVETTTAAGLKAGTAEAAAGGGAGAAGEALKAPGPTGPLQAVLAEIGQDLQTVARTGQRSFAATSGRSRGARLA